MYRCLFQVIFLQICLLWFLDPFNFTESNCCKINYDKPKIVCPICKNYMNLHKAKCSSFVLNQVIYVNSCCMNVAYLSGLKGNIIWICFSLFNNFRRREGSQAIRGYSSNGRSWTGPVTASQSWEGEGAFLNPKHFIVWSHNYSCRPGIIICMDNWCSLFLSVILPSAHPFSYFHLELWFKKPKT